MRQIIERTAPTVLMKRHLEEEVAALRRQLRRVSERNSAAFDQGFLAATKAAEAGADPQRLLEMSGVVSAEWADTMPIEMPVGLFAESDAEDTYVEIQSFPASE